MYHRGSRRLSRREFLALVAQGLAALTMRPPSNVRAAEKPGPPVTLDMQIGQMLMVGFNGIEVDAAHPIVRDMQDRHLGGVILFDRDTRHNITSPQQVRALVETLHLFSATPLLVAIDYEGGTINRLKEEYGFPPTRSHQELGEQNDLLATRAQAEQMAQTLAQLGITLNLAPVLDLNTNPRNPIIGRYGRSFSADPDIVTQHAIEFIRAHHEYGVLCSLKHFPGHGSSTTDSHVGMTDITQTWSRAELEPYRRIMEAGLADTIMTAHVYHETLDPDYPATMSHAIITGLLREQLEYDGVVLSDDMQMGAITNYYGFEVAVQKAVEAGVDIIMVGNEAPAFAAGVVDGAVTIIKRMIEDGRVSVERIEESYRRIVRLKRKLNQKIPNHDATAPVDNPNQAGVRYFYETGHTLRGPFLTFWEEHQGEMRFGLPLTEEFSENGRTVQYFERVRLEYHPEYAGSTQAVMIGSLGFLATEERRHEPVFQPAPPGSLMGVYFSETGHYLAPEFVAFWEQPGGLVLYGYPISESFVERNPLTGESRLVQYFERARLEYHPRRAGSDLAVTLGLLGYEELRRRGWLWE